MSMSPVIGWSLIGAEGVLFAVDGGRLARLCRHGGNARGARRQDLKGQRQDEEHRAERKAAHQTVLQKRQRLSFNRP